ncbi:TetR/AcrR family transcriptional regulator [Rhodococcus sp. IEGM 1330]|uniref:TetR/AcrR family transcriptional regulator n=1 Tax=Rhodococcus sp. IEGM 1330 TaxID=3082225 RepID=UPI002953D690|nr:TetR/AcrR family transcriptional regulator [Rhodococcus sp. IEGM 1330]MDV8023521.1 TetR/AcrR family transcriptional regulator [Rhodococcus sp. IEGM 1330]
MTSSRGTRPKEAGVFDDAVSAAAARHLALFPAASMQELAAAAGVSRATLFRRFPSREALVVQLCEAAVRAFVGVVDTTDPGRGEPTAALRRVVSELAELAPVVGLLGLQPLVEHVESALLERISGAEERLRLLIRRGQEAGEFRVEVDPEWFLTMLTWLMVGSADSVRLGRLTPAGAQRNLTATIEATVLRPR